MCSQDIIISNVVLGVLHTAPFSTSFFMYGMEILRLCKIKQIGKAVALDFNNCSPEEQK